MRAFCLLGLIAFVHCQGNALPAGDQPGHPSAAPDGGTDGAAADPGLPPASTECTSMDDLCPSCCMSNHAAAAAHWAEVYYDCLCSRCPACSDLADCGGSSPDVFPACSNCIESDRSCEAMGKAACAADPDCVAYEACGEGCNN